MSDFLNYAIFYLLFGDEPSFYQNCIYVFDIVKHSILSIIVIGF